MVILFMLIGFLKPTPLSSLIVPGSYQIQVERNRGYAYLIAETGLWIYKYLTRKEIQSASLQAKLIAYEHATGIQIDDDQTLSLMEKFRSFDDYYEYLYREARMLYPDEPEKQDEYVRSHIETQTKWKWKDLQSWNKFQDMRTRARELENRATILTGFILSNHLISFIDAFILHRTLKRRRLEMGFAYHKNAFMFLIWKGL